MNLHAISVSQDNRREEEAQAMDMGKMAGEGTVRRDRWNRKGTISIRRWRKFSDVGAKRQVRCEVGRSIVR